MARSALHGLSVLFTAALTVAAATGCSASVTPGGDSSVMPDVVTRSDTVTPPDVPRVDGSDVVTMGRVPRRHRATAETCPADRPASTCMATFGMMCTSDAQCTAGTNGRCVGNAHDGCRCNYDQCRTDGDCTTGGPCACRLASRGAAGANVCLGGNCRTDSDCGAGGYCSPTLGDCGDYGGVVGYYCHTASDECIDDEDCATGDAGFLGQRPYCRYAREVGRWTCSNQGCAG